MRVNIDVIRALLRNRQHAGRARVVLGACLILGAAAVLGLSGCQPSPAPAPAPSETPAPEWLSIDLVDARSGETFALSDFAGQVVLVETMATWCPTCIHQGQAVQVLHARLGDPDDLISVSLDVDVNEDQDLLKAYVEEFGFEWRFAVAPLAVARALGNLYSAQYLNPPLAPMLIVDRQGGIHPLDFGLKDAETLQTLLEPYLAP